MGRRAARTGRAAALHGLSPGLQDARPAAHAGKDAHPREKNRARQRPPLRIYGQRPRHGGRQHVLPRLRHPRHRTRLVRPRRVHGGRSEEHTSELQSRENVVCRLLLEKKKKKPRALLLSKKKLKNTLLNY